MKKVTLLKTVILAALAVPGLAMAEEASPFSGNVSMVSNYLYRGVSQTNDKAAIQGGFDFAHSSGFYAGAWASSISWLADSGLYDSSSMELDTYAGFTSGFAEDFTYNVGFLRYNYPGEYSAANGQITANTNELYGALGWKWLTAKYSRSFTNLFGTPDSSGSAYAELNGSYKIEDIGLTLDAHYGKQTVANNSAFDYADYNLKASRSYGGYTVGVLFSKTDMTGDTTKGVLSLSHAM